MRKEGVAPPLPAPAAAPCPGPPLAAAGEDDPEEDRAALAANLACKLGGNLVPAICLALSWAFMGELLPLGPPLPEGLTLGGGPPDPLGRDDRPPGVPEDEEEALEDVDDDREGPPVGALVVGEGASSAMDRDAMASAALAGSSEEAGRSESAASCDIAIVDDDGQRARFVRGLFAT